MLLTMRSAGSNEKRVENLKRFAKSSKILDVAIANRVSKESINPFHGLDQVSMITSAVGNLYNALTFVSNKYDKQEASQLSGLAISKEEDAEIIARGKKLCIT